MHNFPISIQSPHHHLAFFRNNSNLLSLLPTVKTTPSPNLFFFFSNQTQTLIYPSKLLLCTSSSKSTSNFDHPPIDNYQDEENDDDSPTSIESISDNNGVDIEIEKIGKNSRRIRSQISIDSNLETVWDLLTDYERLADFIPGLAVSQLLEKRENFAKIFQIGQQSLAFGLKFDAKGIVECYEKDMESLPSGRRRDIEFKMVEGDFQTFEGKWSIEETYSERYNGSKQTWGKEEKFKKTTLSYVVEVKPKMWLPVGLVEGRLCREVKLNLACIREEAMKDAVENSVLPTS